MILTSKSKPEDNDMLWRLLKSRISPRALHRLIGDGDLHVIDVNSTESWRRAHVPGALNLDPAAYTASDLPSDKEADLVFYCSNIMCRKAPDAARRARRMGYRNVRVMSAGIRGWLRAALPTERG